MKREFKFCNTSSFKPRAPWFDNECKDSRNQARRALRHYLKFKSATAKEQYSQMRNQYKSLIREKKRVNHKETNIALNNSLRDSRAFWKIVRSRSRRTPQQVRIDMESWKSHFENTFKLSNRHEDRETVDDELVLHDLLDAKITTTEVRGAITKLKASKAPGMDGIPGGCIKVASDKLTPFLTKLFNALYDASYFPEMWSRSIILPLHKKGDVQDTNNYRGISLLCAVCKIFTTILTLRLRIWMEQENKVCVEQAGFRSQYSTLDHMCPRQKEPLVHLSYFE